MKKGILFSLLFICKIAGHGQTFMPSFHPANYNSSYNKTFANIEVLAVGAGGGGGGWDGNYGAGGGAGGVVYSKITSMGTGTFNIAIGGGGGSGSGCLTSAGAGAAGANGGGAGGNAGNGGCSGGGGGGGGWSGVYNSTTSVYYVVAGGGAGGGGSNEGMANDVAAPGGGTQTAGANATSMTGANGSAYSGDGGGGGGGGGGYYGGAGQNPNSSSYGYSGSGGANYANATYTTGTVTYNGNASSGNSSNGNPGAAVTVTNATDFGYTNNKGGGGQAPYGGGYGVSGTDGIVIIRYYGPQRAIGGVVTTVNGYTVHTFTSAGTLTFKMLPVKGALAHYMATEFASGATPTTWTDQTGNGYNATMSGMTAAVSSVNLKNNIVLQGSSTSSVTFPVFANWTVNSKYTTFVVERYTSTNSTLQKRIITDYTSNNWLTGHWSTHVGVSYHNNWITDQPNGITTTVAGGTDWILFTDQSAYSRCNGTDVSKYAPGANIGFNQLGINTPGWSGEKSNFEIAEFIIYPRELNAQEINFVETYLINKYGVAGYNDGLMLNLDAANKQSYDGNGTTWTDLVSGNQIQWSSSLAPVYKIDNGVSVFSTTPTIGTTRSMVSSGYVNLREGNGAYSVMAIFKPNSITAGKVLVSMGPASAACSGYIIHSIGIGTGGKFSGGACGSLGTWSLSNGVTPTVDKFWCVTTTYSGGTNGTETVYVDGQFDKSATMTTNTPVDPINRFNVGWIRDGEPQYTMDANVALILYYNRALSAAEVLALYNKYKKKLSLP
jgi:hypothetical protein